MSAVEPTMGARAPTAPHPPMPAAELQLARALIYITPVLWSVNYLVARWAPDIVAPHALALGRWTIAALVLAAFCWRELWTQRALIRAEWRQSIVLGALGMWICGAFVYIGGRSTTAVNMGLVYAVSPVLIALGSALWLRERVRAAQVVGVALALTGMLHILLRGDWSALARLQFNPGDIWIAAATLSWTAYSLLLRAWPSSFGAVARLTLTACGGIVVLVPFTLWEALYWLPTEVSWRSVGLVTASALIPGAGAFAAYSYMQKRLGAARVAQVLYLSPLYTALIGWGVLGERIELHHGLGAMLILPGLWLSTRR
jgi:drug/metabolite transporter (DMT)-like permease